MRTLKKSLALVLALVMVLGLGVVGASADDVYDSFTDTDEVGAAYVEAVGVLTGLGVVEGMSDTTPVISPQSTYTRAQAAKIIAVLLLGNDGAEALKCVEAPFDDVQPNQWFAGYVAYCAEKGIIDGMTATTFEPDGTLTGYQWAKMLLAAVGFGKNGEFVGGTWSLNTATVGTQSGLFTGDLEAADHTPIRREQAMLFAFNALTKLRQVTYSANSNNYVYGIKGYYFADNTGLTLGQSTFDLNSVEGVIVDNEGMGAAATDIAVYNRKAWQPAEVTVAADTGIDEMYHAVRCWYVAGTTNKGVYTYDLAKVTTTNCPDATTANAAKYTIGRDADAAYRYDVVDNSALDADLSTTVLFRVAYGTMGYVDPALGTTDLNGIVGANDVVATVDVKSDVSKVEYGDQILFLVTHSTDNAADEAAYITPVTVTVGVVQGYTKDSASSKWSVTLTDGTTHAKSNLFSANNTNEAYTLGQQYTFVLDTHGDVIYATRNGARTLYVFTGETRNTGDYNASSADKGIEYLFLNVTNGEKLWADVYFTKYSTGTGSESTFGTPNRGTYVDINTVVNAAGQLRAQVVDKGLNTYAAGYVVDDVSNVVTGNNYFVAAETREKVYYDPNTVTFLVATGKGEGMTLATHVGVQAFKTAYGIPDDGMIQLRNAAMTVSATETGNWQASVVFVLRENITTYSSYVFIPNDIDIATQWTGLSGYSDAHIVTYAGAYMNGEKYELKIKVGDLDDFADGTIHRGFYTLKTTYDAYGNATVVLDEKVDNNFWGNCYYAPADTVNTGTGWEIFGRPVSTEVKIVDLTNPTHNVTSMSYVWQWLKNHEDGHIAFTVNPVTEQVNVIYLVDAGWDAEINVTLSEALTKAGWKLVDDDNDEITISLKDDDAYAYDNQNQTVLLYNEKLAAKSTGRTTYSVTVTEDNSKVAAQDVNGLTLNNGVIAVTFNVADIKTTGNKQLDYTIDGLVIGTVTINGSGLDVYKVTPNEKVVLGTEVTVQLDAVDNGKLDIVWIGDCKDRTHYNWTCQLVNDGGDKTDQDYMITDGELVLDDHVIEFTFVPFHNNATYTVNDAAWAHVANH